MLDLALLRVQRFEALGANRRWKSLGESHRQIRPLKISPQGDLDVKDVSYPSVPSE